MLGKSGNLRERLDPGFLLRARASLIAISKYVSTCGQLGWAQSMCIDTYSSIFVYIVCTYVGTSGSSILHNS